MDFRNKCKDLKSVILDGYYDMYDEQNTYILSVANLDSGCGGGEF